MYILIISSLIGMAIGLIINTIFAYSNKLVLEKKLKGRLSDSDPFKLKGLTGMLFFIAIKLGNLFEKTQFKTLHNLSLSIENNLKILGKPYSTIKPYTFIGIQFLSIIGVTLFLYYIFDTLNILILLISGGLGIILPYSAIQEKVKAKHKAIFRQLPDVLDLLTLMVESGLDFNNALNKILDSEQGELIKEFSIVQQEIKLGKSRTEAFNDMAKRINYTPLNSVINSLTNAFSTGGSIAPILRTLSDQFRVERAQLAEKLAAQAPLKLMFPLVLFIFPTIFIIIFGPIVLFFISSGGF
ncbi:MAG: type II secretion system F family protein [Endomicrobiales bacterium]|nr:type II secretion system F family protein [Endomicrobiales bacterium]